MSRHVIASVLTVVAFAALAFGQAGRVHRLEATPSTVAYGYYWSEARPALRIASGDVVDVDTLLTNTPAGLERAGVAPEKVEPSLRAVVSEVTGERRGPGGHILTGPVYVEGAEPGDALQVDILSIDLPIDYGYNGCSGFVRENCDRSVGIRIIPLDRKAMTATFAPGIVLPLTPFFGSMGVAPDPSLGRLSSTPPGRHAGNIDNKELVAGTTLYIPVFVPGALFEVGDGHATQGDGEVDQTAIETSMRGKLRLTVRKGMTLAWPRAETPTHYISMATDPDLAVATKTAIQEMIDFLAASKGVTKHEAYQLISLAGDVAVTQLVDQTLGVHVKMPKRIWRPAPAKPAAGGDAMPVPYRLQLLQAAPGRLLDLIDAVKRHAATAAAAAEAAPVIMRHSQGDHWDLAVLWPLGDRGTYDDPARVANREAARSAGALEAGLERQLDPLVSWHEDLFLRGPSVDALRAHVKDAGLLHYEMMQALPGRREALVDERKMENAFNRNRGRGETLIFVREAGAAWDVVTLGAYRNWMQYAESDIVPKETSDAAARKAGFPNADGVGPYMRTLISTHRDTLGPQIR
jgi:acetamidase/formamidase